MIEYRSGLRLVEIVSRNWGCKETKEWNRDRSQHFEQLVKHVWDAANQPEKYQYNDSIMIV